MRLLRNVLQCHDETTVPRECVEIADLYAKLMELPPFCSII